MTTLADTIVIKSDQLNGDDLIAGPINITIAKVTKKKADSQQPISIHYEGDGGKPWKPCLTMRKLLIAVWGDNVDDIYIGRRLTLYRDASVKWAGREEGGIRISHMSHITESQTMLLAETRGVKKPHTVHQLKDGAPATIDVVGLKVAGAAAAEKGTEELRKWWLSLGAAKQKAAGGEAYLTQLKSAAAAVAAPPNTDGGELPGIQNDATQSPPEV